MRGSTFSCSPSSSSAVRLVGGQDDGFGSGVVSCSFWLP